MKISSIKECLHYIRCDAYRYTGGGKWLSIIKLYFSTIGFRYTCWMRICTLLLNNRITYPFFVLAKIRLIHISHNSGIQISYRTNIGEGFYIGHYGTMVVNSNSIIGKNVNISPGVNIGQANRGKYKGVPQVGDNVYIGPGAKLIGAIKIGNNVCIGANAVVTKDVPDNACVAGVPAEIISMKGAIGYVNRTV